MGKKKEQHFDSVHIDYIRHSDKLFKLIVYVGWFNNQKVVAEFFIPRSEGQSPVNIDGDAVRARLKRDFHITFTHNSATYK